MTFRLRIPGRDDVRMSQAANPANSLIDSTSVSELAKLAAPPVCLAARALVTISGLAELADHELSVTMDSSGGSTLLVSLRRYTQTTIMLKPDVAAAVEIKRRAVRRARLIWMGYVEVADQLVEILAARDQRLDDRRLCVECAYAGPNRNCRKKQGFLTDVLQRCKSFDEAG